MRFVTVAVLALMACFVSLEAQAGPEGKYFVQGTNPGSGTGYEGTLIVQRTGETYSVVWDVGGTRYVGTALGASYIKGVLTMGPAADKDIALSISYVAGDSYGIAFMIEQPNGLWSGVWTYGGSNAIATEVWTRR
jgi:hypothetical protein